MKGIILAGGLGTRLRPITKILNKNLLLVYDKPLIYYPIQTLKEAGIKDILIVCGPEYAEQYVKLMGTGEELGVNLSYTIQAHPKGIAHGLSLGRHFAEGGKIALILADNIFGDNFLKTAKKFEELDDGALFIIKKVSDPERFGVIEFTKDGKKIKNIVEKPAKPKSPWAVTGLYFYDHRVFDIIASLNPSARGEYEITDVNNFYIKEGSASYFKTNKFWVDAGTFDSLFKANVIIASRTRKKF